MEQREIKFRAWDKYKNEMVPHSWEIDTNTEGPYLDLNGEAVCFHYSEGGGNIGDVNDRFVLMQYTGLKDSWKNEIWEGDVAKILYTDWPSKTNDDPRTLDQYLEDISIPGEIVFHKGAFCLMVDNLKFGGKDYLELRPGAHGFIKVIGNIYEHPHLITPATHKAGDE